MEYQTDKLFLQKKYSHATTEFRPSGSVSWLIWVATLFKCIIAYITALLKYFRYSQSTHLSWFPAIVALPQQYFTYRLHFIIFSHKTLPTNFSKNLL